MNRDSVFLIARYESKMLRRGVLFRVLSVTILIAITILHLLIHGEWDLVKHAVNLPACMPYVNAYLFAVFQAFAVFFVAGDFLVRDKVKTTNDVFWVRDVSNREYFVGKFLGAMGTFVVLNLVAMLPAMFINLWVSDFGFNPILYVYYMVTISIPVLFFTLGISFMVKSWVKSTSGGMLFLLTFFVFTLWVFPTCEHGVFDFMASRVPNLFSPLTGHPALGSYLLHRLSFICVGAGLFVLSIIRFERLPDCPGQVTRTGVWGGGIVMCGVLVGFVFWLPFQLEEQKRMHFVVVQGLYDSCAKVNIERHELACEIDRARMTGCSVLTISNNQSSRVDSLIFYLNPSLDVTGIYSMDHEPLAFNREEQVIVVYRSLDSREKLRLKMVYVGMIDTDICYLDVAPKDYGCLEQDETFICVGRKYAFMEKSFTLLTPEALWYPTARPLTCLTNPYMNTGEFTDYELRVVSRQGNTVISQGSPVLSGDTVCFRNKGKLLGITLIAGPFRRDSCLLANDRVNLEFYFTRENSFLKGALKIPAEDRKMALRRVGIRVREMSPNQVYPFTKLALVEVPATFYAFERAWKEKNDYVHPEMLFQPEWRGEARIDVEKRVARREIRDDLSEEQARMGILTNDYLSLIGGRVVPGLSFRERIFYKKEKRDRINDERLLRAWGTNRYSLAPLLEEYTTLISSGDIPVIHRVVRQLFKLLSKVGTGYSERLTYHWKGIEYLARYSLWDALQDEDVGECMKEIIYLKSLQLQSYILTRVEWDDFIAFGEDFMRQHPNQEVVLEYFLEKLQERLGVDLAGYMQKWLYERGIASLLVRDFCMGRVEIGGEEKMLIHFKVWNPTEVDAIVTLSSWKRWNVKAVNKSYLIEKKSCKEVNYYTNLSYKECGDTQLEMNLSGNLPGVFRVSGGGSKLTRGEEGVFDCDTSRFSLPRGEFVVDDADPGFSIVGKKRFSWKEGNKYSDLAITLPIEWKSVFYLTANSYGNVIRGFHCKGAGGKKTDVEWSCHIPEAGTYEMYIYMVECYNMGVQPPPRYTFFHDGKKEQVTVYLSESATGVKSIVQYANREVEEVKTPYFISMGGWVSAGRFELSGGDVKLTLHDDGLKAGEFLVADAVKWVRVEE